MSSNLAAVFPFSELERMAAALSASRLFGVKDPAQALGLILLCQAEGLHPATAARDYHVVDGKPALKADAMLARFHAAGGKHEFTVYTDERVTGVFSHSSGGTLTLTWTIEQARSAGLAGKSVWKQYPRAMLRARVISEAIRTVYPAVLVGVYTPEEVADFDTRPVAAVSAAPVAQVVESLPALQPAIEPEPEEGSITAGQIRALGATLREAGFDGGTEEGKAQGRAFLAWLAGRPGLASVKELNWVDGTRILKRLAGPSAGRGEYRADPLLVEQALSDWYRSQASDDRVREILAGVA